MEIVFYIVFISAFVFLFSFLIIPYVRDIFRSGKMGNITDSFTCKCGGYIGHSHLSYPFVKLTISSSFLNIKTSENINKFVPFKKINNLKIKKGFFSEGISFDFNEETLIIWTPYCYKIKDYIEKTKYE